MIESWLLSEEMKGGLMEITYKNQNELHKKVLDFVKTLSHVEKEYFLMLLKKREQIRFLKMLVEDRERA